MRKSYTNWFLGLLLIRLLPPLPASATPDETALFTQLAAAKAAAVEEPSFGEYEIKAGFIYRFISFVSWPGQAPDDDTITIAILGNNPFGDAFSSIEEKMVGNRVVKIKYFNSEADIEALKACRILYLSSSLETRQQDILRAMGDSPTLTVGDSRGFIDKGGMIGFVRRDNGRIGIELNVTAVSRAGLTIRSMLKRIAVRIITRNNASEP